MLKWRFKPKRRESQNIGFTNIMADNNGFYSHHDDLGPNKKRNSVELRQVKIGSRNESINSKHSNDLYGETDEDIKESRGFILEKFDSMGKNMKDFTKRKRCWIRALGIALLNIAVFAYFFVALDYWIRNGNSDWEFCDGFGMLLILMSITYFYLIYFLIVKRYFGKVIYRRVMKPMYDCYVWLWEREFCRIKIVRVMLYALLIGILILYLVLDTVGSRERLVSLVGLAIILLLGFIFSTAPTKIAWRPVIWGIFLQFVMGLFTIRLKVGRDIFQCIGDKVSAFLALADNGSEFVFGNLLVKDLKVFCFQVLPVIFFFSLIIEILFYWGAMQWICLKLGWCLQVTMSTTVCESVICAANTFLGMSESPLLIKPYIEKLTKSEIHTIMGSGFATVSGSVLAAYISFGVEPAHLITASVMSAPAALCFTKLFYPETEESKTAVTNIPAVVSENTSVLDAASRGASNAIPLILGIVASLVSFIALVALVNALLGWFGGLVGLEFLSLEWIFGKVFIPLSWVMGVPWKDCELVGSLIGLKTVVNEFVAYQRMGEYKEQGLLSTRAETIATYALCGFSNPSSVGILVGALSAMAPSRRSDIANLAVRSFISGCAVCFMTACIAGLLMTDDAFISHRPPSNVTTPMPFF